MFSRNKSRAETISEYALVLGLAAAGLMGMQTYMKRGIQAVVKAAADEMGSQKKGGIDYDYNLKLKVIGDTTINATSNGSATTNRFSGGAVSYDTNQSQEQSGILSHTRRSEKE